MAASETVVATGADALEYVESQATQALGDLEVGGRGATLLLDPTGTIVAVAVVRRPDATTVSLEVPAGTGAATVARLERFAIRAAATFTVTATEDPGEWFADDATRVRAGVPGEAELAHGLVPHGLGASLLARTVSFTKGCYPGQELVARMDSRHATPPFVLRGLVADEAIEVGDAVGDDARPGEVTSVASRPESGVVALCVLHRRDAGGASVEVRRGERRVLARLVEDPSVRS